MGRIRTVRNFRQADSRWGKLGYIYLPHIMTTSGCGATACADIIASNPKYAKYTPKKARKWMLKHDGVVNGAGTKHAAIPAILKAHGFIVKEHPDMDSFFAEMKKNNRRGIILFSEGTRGGVTWTLGGHFVAESGMKIKDGKHYLYTCDPGGRHNDGWHAYETTMKGLIPRIWTAHLPEDDEEAGHGSDPKAGKAGDPSARKTIKCIDVSDHQGNIDWRKVKADGINHVIIRAGYGKNNPDSCFKENIEGAIRAGIENIGIYWFMYSYNETMAAKEGSYCIKAIEPYREHINMFVSADWEYASMNYAKKNKVSPSKSLITKMNKEFCEVVKEAGYTPAVYYNYDYKKNHLNLGELPYINWYALDDSNGKFTSVAVQQYGTAKIDGIGGRVDINWIHDTSFIKEPKKKIAEDPDSSGTYQGEFPSTKLDKTNAQVIEDNIKFLRWICRDNSFHYGYTNKHGSSDPDDWSPNAHHNGCYFCGTNVDHGGRSKKGIKDFKKTYCCNPLIGAAWAHGGCVPKAMELCRKGSSWDYHKGAGYDKSSLFKNLGHPTKSKLKPGDVLCSDGHVAEYIGDGKIAEAHGGDDNVKGSKRWNNSIHITELTDNRYEGFKRVHRYTGSVNKKCCMYHGEVGRRVELLQNFLKWYGYDIKVDGLFGDQTRKAVKSFQQIAGVSVDAVVGPNTIRAMKAARR